MRVNTWNKTRFLSGSCMSEKYLTVIIPDLAKAIDKLLEIVIRHDSLLDDDDYRELINLKDTIQYIIEE